MAKQGEPDGAPKLGNWSLVGKATNGDDWQAVLVLRQENGAYSGTIDWAKNGVAVGVESFAGAFDPSSRRFEFEGLEARGDVVTAKYAAQVSQDGSRMMHGEWMATCGVGATWEAVYLGA